MPGERRPPEALRETLLRGRRLAREGAGPQLAELGRGPFELMAPPPPAPPPPPPVAPPMPAPPQAPLENPFAKLAYPSPGDRIKAEDFRRLSQALQVVADAYALAGATFGFPFGQVKLALAAQQYEVTRVVSVSGTVLASPDDASLDGRQVLQVAPVVLGDRRVIVVVSETSDVRRYMPDLRGLTYRQAAARIQAEVGDLTAGGAPTVAPPLEGLTLTEAARRIWG